MRSRARSAAKVRSSSLEAFRAAIEPAVLAAARANALAGAEPMPAIAVAAAIRSSTPRAKPARIARSASAAGMRVPALPLTSIST